MKKFLATILALLMMLSIVAACNGDTPDTPDAPPPVTGDDGGAPVEVPAPEGHDPRAFQPVPEGPWYTPFPYPVHFTVATHANLAWNFLPGDDISNNPWTRLYQEKLNIYVEFEWAVIDDYETRLNLAIAAGQLPDVFHIPRAIDPRLFHQLVEEGMLLDLTDAYRNYTSDRVRNFENLSPGTIDAFTVDGRIFGIPRYYYGEIDKPWHLWIRQDWYRAEGSPEIRTVEDLENLARAFMQNHGAAYGIAVEDNMSWLLRSSPMFGAHVGPIWDNQYHWVRDETGRIRPGIAMPEFRDALERWIYWAEEGIISRDFPTMGTWGGPADEDLHNGLVGIQFYWQWWGYYYNTIIPVQGPEAVFYPFHMPTVDAADFPAKGESWWGNEGAIVASADFQNPAALMKVISLLDHMIFSPDAGLTEEDLWYFMEEGREHTPSPSLKIFDPNADFLQLEHVLYAFETGDTSQLFTTGMLFKYNESLSWINDQVHTAFGPYSQLGFEGSAYARAAYLLDNDLIVRDILWGPPPPEFMDAGTPHDILMENLPLIILGIEPLEHWDWVLEQWYAHGGQIKEDAMNLHWN